MALTLGKNPLQLVLYQYNVYIREGGSWKLLGYNNGSIKIDPERTFVEVKDGIPRELVSEIHVDDKFTLSFPIRSKNKDIDFLSTSGAQNAYTNATLPAPDTALNTLPNGSTYDVTDIGMLGPTSAFARPAYPFKIEGKRRDGKFAGVFFRRGYVQFIPIDLPNNESNADVVEGVFTVDVFPMNDGTISAGKETGWMYMEQ